MATSTPGKDDMEAVNQLNLLAGARPKAVVLLFFRTMEALADRLIARRPDKYEKGFITWDHFGDGTPNIKIQNVERIRYSHVLLLTSFRHQADWMSQVAVIYALPRYMAKSLTVVLPFFPTGTMERVEQEGEVATAMTMARILSACPSTMQGPPRLVMFDVHTLQQRFYFADTIVPVLLTAMPLLHKKLKELPDANNITIVFPDEGARKRFGHTFDQYPQVVCAKVRVGSERQVTVMDGDPDGRHCVIVDDLVQSGGTLIVCKDVLKQKGAVAVSGFITHAVFPNAAWKKFQNDGWATVFVTDSIPEVSQELENEAPFKVLSIAAEIDRFLYS